VATWIEFHDSILAAVNHIGADVEIVLDAYVLRWEASGNVWTGTGWTQAVRIRLSGIRDRSVVPLLPTDISDGHLRVGTATHDNLVPLPFEAADAINLWLQLSNSEVLEFAGRGVQIDAVGEARFVEDLPLDLRPGQDGWR
jgi:hypothetical protein